MKYTAPGVLASGLQNPLFNQKPFPLWEGYEQGDPPPDRVEDCFPLLKKAIWHLFEAYQIENSISSKSANAIEIGLQAIVDSLLELFNLKLGLKLTVSVQTSLDGCFATWFIHSSGFLSLQFEQDPSPWRPEPEPTPKSPEGWDELPLGDW